MRRGVRFFAWVGEGFLTVYDPQRRSSRARFARETLLWALLGLAGWLSLDPIADAAWISDEMLVAVARAVSWCALAWSAALFPMLARRFHDAGMSGAWSGLALIPCGTPFLIAAALLLPAHPSGRAWPRAEEPFFV